ncbi:unnamed protein product [Sphagnum jensenii]|uniref:Uncharacterized protein n=1 Tax=Sphagnum jensenii TaxID=128206 RepID=A0ABP0V8E7_9BRYO
MTPGGRSRRRQRLACCCVAWSRTLPRCPPIRASGPPVVIVDLPAQCTIHSPALGGIAFLAPEGVRGAVVTSLARWFTKTTVSLSSTRAGPASP